MQHWLIHVGEHAIDPGKNIIVEQGIDSAVGSVQKNIRDRLLGIPAFLCVSAVIALLGQLAVTIVAVSGYFPVFNSFTMTLPGIAGMILSIGMGVDANIITAERIKEELRNGKSVDGAVNAGTKNSLSAIVDGNMTVIIVAVILILVFGPFNMLSFIFGLSTTGSIYAFGYTLLVGVISNFLMGIAAARLMLKSISGFKFMRSSMEVPRNEK